MERDDDSLEFSNLNLPELHDFLTQHSGLPLLYHSNAVTANVSDLSWVLKSASGPPTKVEISAHSTHAHALESFRNNLLLYQAPVEDVLVVPTEALRKGEYCLVSPSECVYGQMSWVRGNIFAHIEGPQPIDSLHSAFIKSIDECFVSHKTTQAELLTPQVTNIAAPSRVKKGEEFSVHVSVFRPAYIYRKDTIANVRCRLLVPTNLESIQDITTLLFYSVKIRLSTNTVSVRSKLGMRCCCLCLHIPYPQSW
jgi:hypothetical protein